MVGTRHARCALGIVAASTVLALGGCARLDLASVRRVAVVHERPPTTIGPRESIGSGPWIEYDAYVSTRQVRRINRLDSTVHLLVADCDDSRALDVEDLYVNGAALNASSNAGWDAVLRRFDRAGSVPAKFYIPEDLARKARALCVKTVGGNMAGARLEGSPTRLP